MWKAENNMKVNKNFSKLAIKMINIIYAYFKLYLINFQIQGIHTYIQMDIRNKGS